MDDEIIKELWQVKDNIANEYDYDAKALVAHLRAMMVDGDQRLVDLRSKKKAAKQDTRAGLQK